MWPQNAEECGQRRHLTFDGQLDRELWWMRLLKITAIEKSHTSFVTVLQKVIGEKVVGKLSTSFVSHLGTFFQITVFGEN